MTGSSRKVWGATKGLGEAPKSCTRKEHESATNSIAKRGQGGTSSLFVCPLQGQGTASLVGFGATPQLFLVRPIPRKSPTKAQAAKRPCQYLCASADAPSSCSSPQDSVKNQMTAIPRHSRQQENGQFLRHAGEYSTIFKHRQLCANANAPASLSADERVLFLYYFQICGAGFHLTAPPPASAAAPACGHPPRPPAWASPTVPPHTADSAS